MDNEWKKLTHMFYTEKGNKQKDIKNYLSKIELKISVITAPLLLENASKIKISLEIALYLKDLSFSCMDSITSSSIVQ